MAVQTAEKAGGKVLEVKVTGKLTAKDYKHFVPELEGLIQQHGKISVLFEMADFHGWEMGALWEDIKFDAKHFADIERLAMVGEKRWQKGMAATPTILNAASELPAQLLIVGTRGRTGLSRIALGSVAEAVVRTAPCSVLTVRLVRAILNR
jgi:hypothetical protein